MQTAPMQFLVVLTDERRGPRGGKAKPIVNTYVVAAYSREEALDVFRQECPNMILDTTDVSVVTGDCRVWRAA